MNMRCWHELVGYGAVEVLRREYGALLKEEAEPDYNVSLEVDLEQIPLDAGQHGAYLLNLRLCIYLTTLRVSRSIYQVHLDVETQCACRSV